ncbi:MAG TPA: hypothetical protein PL084_12900, partial [Chitinophagales bacterium]|nr:hypothetical protein [Chitinophagales bacterium]
VQGVQCSGIPTTTGTIAATNPMLCNGASTSLSLTGFPSELGITYQWESSPAGQNNFSPIAGATGFTYTSGPLNANIDYRVAVICNNIGGGTAHTNVVSIVVANPQLLTTAGATRCGTGTVNLTATASAGNQVNWYNAATGGAPLMTNAPSFTTPVISATDTFYAAASTPGLGSATMPMPAHGSNYTGNVRGFYFTAPTSFTITGLEALAQTTGAQSIAIVKFNNNTPPPIFSLTTNAFTTLYITQNNPTVGTIPVNIPINAGDVIGVLGQVGNASSYATPTGQYVSTIAGQNVTLTRMGMQFSLNTTAPQDLWEETSGAVGRVAITYSDACEGTRVPVVATVTTPPYTLSANPPTICSAGSTTISVTSANNYTYSWTPTGSGSSFTVSPTTTTKYYVTGTDGNNCSIYDSITINVVSTPAATAAIATPSSICGSGTTTLSLSTPPMPGIGIQWEKNTGSGYAAIAGATTATYTDAVTATSFYRALMYCNSNLVATSTADTVTYSNPTVIQTFPGSRCGTGPVTLAATAGSGGTIKWYANATGGSSLASGNAFTTPSISSTTTYYAAAASGAGGGNAPEMMYYKFDVPGTSVANEASAPVGTNPATVTGLTIGGTGQFGTGLQGTAGPTATNNVNPGWTGTHNGSWTISFWANMPAPSTTRYFFGNSSGNGTFRCFIGGVANTIRLTGGVPSATLDMPNWVPGASVITYVYDATLGTLSGYINGVFQLSVSPGNSYPLVGTNFVVGSQGNSIDGTMDEFRMYSRALSAAEVASVYNVTFVGCEGTRVPVTATINPAASGTGLATGGTTTGASQGASTTQSYTDACNDTVAVINSGA